MNRDNDNNYDNADGLNRDSDIHTTREQYHHDQPSNHPESEYGPDTNQSAVPHGYQGPIPQQHSEHKGWKICLGLLVALCCGWFIADHVDNQPQQATPQKTIVERVQPTKANQSSGQDDNQQQKLNGLEDKLNQMGINAQSQQKALQFFQKQSAEQQQHIEDLVGTIDRLVPSNSLKRDAVSHVIGFGNQ